MPASTAAECAATKALLTSVHLTGVHDAVWARRCVVVGTDEAWAAHTALCIVDAAIYAVLNDCEPDYRHFRNYGRFAR